MSLEGKNLLGNGPGGWAVYYILFGLNPARDPDASHDAGSIGSIHGYFFRKEFTSSEHGRKTTRYLLSN
jgi:hypothetical protein